MLGNIFSFLILLCSVVVCEEQSTTTAHSTITNTMLSKDTTQTPQSDSTTTPNLSASPTALSTTQIQPNNSVNGPTGDEQGLTAGQIAGVTVGSITGVAVLGGGIFAGLKYSGKLGG